MMTDSSGKAAKPKGWSKLRVPRNSHQAASVVLAVGAVLGGPILAMGFPDGSLLEVTGLILFIAAILAHFFMMCTAIGILAESEDADLDEREQRLRDRAHRIAFRIVYAVFAATFLALLLVDIAWGGVWAIDGDRGLNLLLLVMVAISSLPAAVLAWIEPDPLPEEE